MALTRGRGGGGGGGGGLREYGYVILIVTCMIAVGCSVHMYTLLVIASTRISGYYTQ